MLRVIQTKSGAGAKSYYAQSDYLSEGQELVGRWGGKAATILGLSGTVDKQSFDRLCDNLDPRSGNRLTLRSKSERTVGYDFNFHAPKGVTAAYLLGDDQRVMDVFRASVDATMHEVEEDASTRVRKHGQMEERRTGNLVWGGFEHLTTREIDGEPDPHLHAHQFVFNVTWDDAEQSFKAVQFRELKRDASYYEAAFHARLASGMRELGYQIRRSGREWDIDSLTPETLKKFSRRTEQIEALAEELGIEDAKEKDGLGAKSRVKKSLGKSMSALKSSWLSRLDADESAAVAAMPPANSMEPEAVIDASREAEAMAYAKLHCFERDSVVPTRKVLTEALRQGLGHVSVEGVHRQADEQRLINRKLDGRSWSTTPEVLVEETTMLKSARSGRQAAEPLNAKWQIQRSWLNAGQQRAVMHVLQSRDKLMMIKGGAGTGKTSLMKEAVEGIAAGGKKVFTFAPSAEASRGVLAAEGFSATTVAELLLNDSLKAETAGQVIWVDEAGLLGTRTLKQVMDIAEQNGARLILSGDWRQHGAVERGAAMRLLEQQAGIRPAVVQKIQRQEGAYRDMVASLAKGDTEGGFTKLTSLGWVHEIEDADARYRAMAESYANGLNAGETVLAIAPTHAEAQMLTNHIRGELVRRGMVAEDGREFTSLKPMHLTEAEKGEAHAVAAGDVMVFQRKASGFQRGQKLDTSQADPAKLKRLARSFEVYRKQSLTLARGDLIRVTANGKTKDGKHQLNNGASFRVKDFDERGNIVLQNGWVVDRDYGFLTTGYTITSHASQGKTVDRVLIAESELSYGAAGAEQFYVSVSRGRHKAEVFTDDAAGLASAVMKTDQRLSATELLDNSQERRMRAISRARQFKSADVEKQREVAYERV